MINTRTRSMRAAAVLATGFLVAGMSATAASADTPMVAPTVDPLCGPNNDAVTIPVIEGVTYSDTGWVGGERTITAAVDEGNVLDGQSEWTFTDEATVCPIEIAGVDVTVVDPRICGPNNDTLNIPEVAGLTFEDTGWVDGERTITATADENYVLDGQSEWTFTDDPTICPFEFIEDDATTAAPAVVPVCGPNNDTVIIPEVEGVIYADGGWVGGERTITAIADEGYDLVVGADAEWTFTDVPVAACPDEGPAFSYTPTGELAYSGATPATGPLGALAILLLASGAALVSRGARA